MKDSSGVVLGTINGRSICHSRRGVDPSSMYPNFDERSPPLWTRIGLSLVLLYQITHAKPYILAQGVNDKASAGLGMVGSTSI
jgi:hypothetical protein